MTTNGIDRSGAAGGTGAVVTPVDVNVVDAKGDLIVGTADNAVDNLTVGTNEMRLVADSTQTLGLKYVADTTNYAINAKGDLLVGTADNTAAPHAVGTDFFDLAADSSQTDGLGYRKPVAAVASGRNIAARTNSGTPNTKLDITADELVVRATNGGAVVLQTVNVTIDFGTTGANGLDTGAQASSTWYYGWVIAKPDGTVAGLGSTSSSAPTMPSGYTFKALVTAARSDGSTHFLKYRQFGNWAYYEAKQSALVNGGATVETAVSLSAMVPPNAMAIQLFTAGKVTSATPGDTGTADIRVVSGSNFFEFETIIVQVTSSTLRESAAFVAPNISQQVFYIWASGGSPTLQLDIDVMAFKIPLGGE